MPWCPRCQLEYNEDFKKCPECGSRLVDEIGQNDPVYLKTVDDGPLGEVTISVLRSYGIPVEKRYLGGGQAFRIIFGKSGTGVDLYVPRDQLETARELLNQDKGEGYNQYFNTSFLADHDPAIEPDEKLEYEDITENDLIVLCDIYNFYAVSSETVLSEKQVDIEFIRKNFMEQKEPFCSKVIAKEGSTIGFFAIVPYIQGDEFNFTGKIELYLRPTYVAGYVMTQAVRHILDIAAKSGFHSVFAEISSKDNYFEILYTHLGFEQCGYEYEIAKKRGKYIDRMKMQKILEDR